jgi:hypothetical protein
MIRRSSPQNEDKRDHGRGSFDAIQIIARCEERERGVTYGAVSLREQMVTEQEAGGQEGPQAFGGKQWPTAKGGGQVDGTPTPVAVENPDDAAVAGCDAAGEPCVCHAQGRNGGGPTDSGRFSSVAPSCSCDRPNVSPLES